MTILEKCQREWKNHLQKNRLRSLFFLSPRGKEILDTYFISDLQVEEPDQLLIEISCLGQTQWYLLTSNERFIKSDDSPKFGDSADVTKDEAKWMNTLFIDFKPFLLEYREEMTKELIENRLSLYQNQQVVNTFYEDGMIRLVFKNGKECTFPFQTKSS